MFHLVSLYPVSAGPWLILFSRTTSKSLIRYPLQAYSSCLFASGYLLAKAARKGVVGECLIWRLRSALRFCPPPQDAAPQQANARADQVRVTEADLSSSHLGGSRGRGGRAKAAGQTLQTSLSHISSPRSADSRRGRTAMCASRGSAAWQFICIYVLRDWKMSLCWDWMLWYRGIRLEVNFTTVKD